MQLDAPTAAGACVAPLLRTLRRCGFCRLPPAAAPATRLAHDAYRALALAVTSAYLAQETLYAYQERGDMEQLARVMFLLLCHATSLVKQVVFALRAASVDRLVERLDDPLFNPVERRRAALVAEAAARARRLGRAYAGAAAATCVLWALYALLARLRGRPAHFAFWLPVACDGPVGFALVLSYSLYVTSLVGVANTTMDAFMATVLAQCKTQLTILRMDLESLLLRATEVAAAGVPEGQRGAGGAPGDALEAARLQLLVRCVHHHLRIYEVVRELQAVFGGAVLVQFGIGGWILCMAAYKIVSLSVVSLEFVSMVMFLVCILTELFLYCYFGNEVAVESYLVAGSAYACGWEHSGAGAGAGGGRQFRRALVVALGAAPRALRPTALLIPLSLETFVTIIKSSYTFYAMLRQTQGARGDAHY